MSDSMRMANTMGYIADELVADCASATELIKLHDRITDEYNTNRHAFDDGLLHNPEGEVVPVPPDLGSEEIVPITTPEALCEEGILMRHCIASYIPDVQKGDYYVYQMLAPERLTIGISLRRGQLHRVDQVKRHGNADPKRKSRELINEWFRAAKDAQDAHVNP